MRRELSGRNKFRPSRTRLCGAKTLENEGKMLVCLKMSIPKNQAGVLTPALTSFKFQVESY
jgi:hypothetical protein